MSKVQEPLRVFFEVAEHESFTQAAKKLHLTQSAVSQHVKNLENELGTTLVDRSNRRGIRVTETGRIAHEYARRILQIEEEMRRRIDDAGHIVRGALKIGASYTVGEYILPHILAEFHDLYPEIVHQVEIYNTPTVVQAMLDRRLDVGLVESTVTSHKSSLRVETLTQDQLLLIVPNRHKLSDRIEVEPHELAQETWIVREQGSGTREYTDDLLKRFGIYTKHLMAFSSTHGIKAAVRSGLGIAFISSWAIETERTLHTLPVLRLAGADLSRPLSMLIPPTAVTSTVGQVFAEFARKRFRSNELS